MVPESYMKLDSYASESFEALMSYFLQMSDPTQKISTASCFQFLMEMFKPKLITLSVYETSKKTIAQHDVASNSLVSQ